MRTTGKATDLITFSRSSGGTALRKIGYDADVAPLFSTYGLVGTGTWTASGSDYVFEDTVGSQVRPGVSWPFKGLSAGIYFVEINIASITGATQVRVDAIGATDQLIGAGESSFVAQVTSESTPRIRIEDTSTSVGDGFAITSFSVKPVLFDQGDLTLFNHPADIPRIEYDANGNVLGLLVEESRTNLLTYSEAFDNAYWVKVNTATLAADATGPDGQTSAVTLVDSGASGTGEVQLTRTVSVATSTAHTFSVYLKPNGLSWAVLRTGSFTSGDGITYFDLANGTTGTVAAAHTASVQDIGNGWYRCSVTFTTDAADTSGNVYIYVADANNDASVDLDGTSSILIYGAQLEAGSFPTSYIPTSGSTATRAADSAEILLSEFGANKAAGTFVAEFNYKDSDNTDNNYVAGGTANARIIYNNAGTNLWQTFDGTAAVTFQGIDGDGESNKLALAVETGKDISTAKNGSIVASSTTATNLMTELHNTPIPFIAIGGGSVSQMLNGHIKSIKYIPRRLTNDQLVEITS